MAKSKMIAGVDLGGTNMQIGIVDAANQVTGEAKKKTRAAEGMEHVVDRIVQGIQEACAQAGVAPRDLAAIGIGAPGAIDQRAGVVLNAVNLRWNNVPLADIVTRRLGPATAIENDVNAAVYGESRLGAGRGVEDLLGVWIGTGVGGGLIIGGELYRGAGHTAGEFGHMTLFPGNPPGARSVEEICSRASIVERLVKLIRSNHLSMLTEMTGGDLHAIKARTIAAAYDKGDDLTREVVDDVARLLGIAIAGIVTLLSLPRVVLGGGLTEAMGESLVSKVRKSARAEVFPAELRSVEVVATTLEDNAGVLGAALLARERLRTR